MIKYRAVITLIGVAVLLAVVFIMSTRSKHFSHQANSKSNSIVKESFVANAADIRNEAAYFVSPDYKRFAYIKPVKLNKTAKQNELAGKQIMKRYQLFVDKNPHQACTFIDEVQYSSDSKQIMYICYRSIYRDPNNYRDSVVIINKKVGPAFDFIEHLKISADNKHIAYMAQHNNKTVLVRDHKVVATIDGRVRDILISNNGSVLIASVEKSKGKSTQYFIIHVHVNGKIYISGQYVYLQDLEISADSNHFIFKGMMVDQEHLVLDGKKGKWYKDIDNIQLGQNSRRLSYTAKDKKKHYLIIHNLKTDKINIRSNKFYFHPESNRFIGFTKASGENHYIYDKNVKQGPYYQIIDFKFSKIGNSYAFIASTSTGELMVINGKKGKHYDRISSYVENMNFSNDGTRFMYSGVKPLKRDGRTVVLDEKEIASYKFVSDLKFSRDSKNYAFLGHVFNELGYEIIFNGRTGKFYKKILDNGKYLKDEYFYMVPNSKTIRYYVQKKSKNIYLVSETFK